MSKSGLYSHEQPTFRQDNLKNKQKFRFIGLSLGGGKADKACLAVVEYYPEFQKVFLVKIYEKIKNQDKMSADLIIHDLIMQYRESLQSVSFDVPLSLPKCMTCELKCPGYENCGEPEIKWMRVKSHKVSKQKKPKKIFTPYTQRPVEFYINFELEEKFYLEQALGANLAPLTARAIFIKKRIQKELQIDMNEVFPKLSIWRLGTRLKVAKTHLKFHKHSVGGDESRAKIIEALSENNVVFLYQHDVKLMVENNHAFEAFVCAFTGYLKYTNKTEPRPVAFPAGEQWIEFPLGV